MSIFHKLNLSETLRKEERKQFIEHLAKDAYMHVDGIFKAYYMPDGKVIIDMDPALVADINAEREKHGYTKVYQAGDHHTKPSYRYPPEG